MLYDNAQLARVNLPARQVMGNEFYRALTEEVLDCIVRDVINPAGGFYWTQDAESEGEGGKVFVRTLGETPEVLGEEADAFLTTYGVAC